MKELIDQLAKLGTREHRGCSKAWSYAGPCACGADEHNAKVEALRAELQLSLTALEQLDWRARKGT